MPNANDANIRFYLRATGQQSGLRAETTFTDATGDGTGTMTVTPNTVVIGTTSTLTFTFSSATSSTSSPRAATAPALPPSVTMRNSSPVSFRSWAAAAFTGSAATSAPRMEIRSSAGRGTVVASMDASVAHAGFHFGASYIEVARFCDVGLLPDAADAQVSILGEKLSVVRPDGVDTFTAAGRPVATVSNVVLEYRPAPPKAAPKPPVRKR